MSEWTAEDDAQLLMLRAEKKPYKEISAIMGRTVNALDGRYRYIKKSEAARRSEMERKNEMRRENRRAAFRNYPTDPATVPDDVLQDRNARITTPKTITAILLGDPPPGWSSLDRKRQGVQA
jgi:hypothetical protein